MDDFAAALNDLEEYLHFSAGSEVDEEGRAMTSSSGSTSRRYADEWRRSTSYFLPFFSLSTFYFLLQVVRTDIRHGPVPDPLEDIR